MKTVIELNQLSSQKEMTFGQIGIKYVYQSIELRCIAYCFHFHKSPNLYTKNIHRIQMAFMSGRYTLEWLDSLITVSLNPARANPEALLPEEITGFKSKMEKKIWEQKSLLKNEVFGLLEEQKIKLLINQYHSTLIILLDQAFENLNNISDGKPALKKIIKEVITAVDELLTFIEIRFPGYIGTEEKVAPTLLSKAKKEVKQKTEKLTIELYQKTDEQLAGILLNVIHSFCKCKDNQATFQQVWYLKELLNQLISLDNHETGNDNFSGLDKILIYLNFNSEEYSAYLTQKISRKILPFERINDKIDCLQFHLKELNQLPRKAGIALYTQQSNLTDTMANWLTEEIFYLERKIHLSALPVKKSTESPGQKSIIAEQKSKVSCIFSTDQLGIFLRAVDELRVVKARSMTEVFKTIVPHLSTPYKEDLSYDAVRSKSYAAEERDKKIVMETLQQVIEKVKRY